MWFQSTLPQGKWLKRKEQLKLSKSISIHTSAREVTEDMKGFVDFLKISIHTSAREVTLLLVVLLHRLGISIHTSAREVTEIITSVELLQGLFQSTLPQGKWRNRRSKQNRVTEISIHTSAREVTLAIWFAQMCMTFQSTLPQGKWLGMVAERVTM